MKKLIKGLVVAMVMGAVTLSVGCGNNGTPAPEKTRTYQKMRQDANTAKDDIKKGSNTVRKGMNNKTIRKGMTESPKDRTPLKGTMNGSK